MINTDDRIFRITDRDAREITQGFVVFTSAKVHSRDPSRLYVTYQAVDFVGCRATLGRFGAMTLPRDGESFKRFGVQAVEDTGLRTSTVRRYKTGNCMITTTLAEVDARLPTPTVPHRWYPASEHDAGCPCRQCVGGAQ